MKASLLRSPASRRIVIACTYRLENAGAERFLMKSDILIIGGGFAGFSCFRTIDRKKRRVTLLTDRNHFLFTPLLPLAAVGTIEVRSIVESVHLYEKAPGEVVIGKASDIDPAKKEVTVTFGDKRTDRLEYETLVIATGVEVNTYGIPGVTENAYFLKEMKHARVLREKVLGQFDTAHSLKSEERKAALRFAIVGAGATGVETACEIHDLIKHDLSKYYGELAREAEIIIIEAAKDILAVFDRTLAKYAQLKLNQKGIQIMTESVVQEVKPGNVVLRSGQIIPAGTIIWAGGNGTVDFVKKASEGFGAELHRSGRILTGPDLIIQGMQKDHYAIGDCAACPDPKGGFLPQTAQVAMKQGRYMSKVLSKKTTKPFTFKSMGMLASLGSGAAIADLGTFRLKGMFAWWFWKAAYLTRLVSFRNKVSVAFDWMKVRLFGRNTARIDY